MLALIRDGQMIERRNLSLDDVPEHKRYLWRPIEYVGEGIEVETTIQSDRVVIRREPAPAPEPVQDDTSAVIAALIAKQEELERQLSQVRGVAVETESKVQSLMEEALKE